MATKWKKWKKIFKINFWVIIHIHTPKTPLRNTPHRNQYGPRRKMVILYTHIIELSAREISMQSFSYKIM